MTIICQWMIDAYFRDDSAMSYYGHQQEAVFSVVFHPDSNEMIASGGSDDKCHVWDRPSGQVHGVLEGHSDSVSMVAFSKDGKYLASGGLDGHVRIWDASNEGCLVVDLETGSDVNWIDWHPRGLIILAGCADGSVWMWKIPSGEVMCVFTGSHLESVTCGQFTPDGKSILSACDEGILTHWDPKSAVAFAKFTPKDDRFHKDRITCLDVHADSLVVATGSSDHSGRIIHLTSKKVRSLPIFHLSDV